MWRKEESKTQAVPENSTSFPTSPSAAAPPAVVPQGNSALPPLSPRAIACISKGIRIRGEIIGSEDLFVDGEVEGKLELDTASVTIGPNGHVKADVAAREVIVRGRVNGNVKSRERVHVWASGNIHGDVQSERLVIEEGGVLLGKVEAGKRAEQKKAKDESQAQTEAPAEKAEKADSGTVSAPVVAD